MIASHNVITKPSYKSDLLRKVQLSSTPNKTLKRNYFNYLLLDPRITRNMQKRLEDGSMISPDVVLKIFIEVKYFS